MCKNNRYRDEKELEQLVNDINQNQNGIYAQPHKSNKDKEETIRLMKEFIEKQRQY